MESTANKATVLAKLFGFYTIEIRNLETGNVQSKVDLLVMENLFYDQKVSKTFDLKGIQGRKVKTSSHIGGTSKTLFDGEWIEGGPVFMNESLVGHRVDDASSRSTEDVDACSATLQTHPPGSYQE
jgi:hypothetical protein